MNGRFVHNPQKNMNANRRSRINKVVGILNEQLSELQMLATEEQEAFDNMPEGLQSSENGQKTEENAQALEDAASEIESQISNLEPLTE